MASEPNISPYPAGMAGRLRELLQQDSALMAMGAFSPMAA